MCKTRTEREIKGQRQRQVWFSLGNMNENAALTTGKHPNPMVLFKAAASPVAAKSPSKTRQVVICSLNL